MLPNWTKDRTTQLEMLEEKGENWSLKVEPSLNIDKETQNIWDWICLSFNFMNKQDNKVPKIHFFLGVFFLDLIVSL